MGTIAFDVLLAGLHLGYYKPNFGINAKNKRLMDPQPSFSHFVTRAYMGLTDPWEGEGGHFPLSKKQ